MGNQELHTQLNGLKEYFETIKTFPDSILLESFAKITNVQKFVNSHLGFCENNTGKAFVLPYLARLEKLAKILQRRQKDRLEVVKPTLQELALKSLEEGQGLFEAA